MALDNELKSQILKAQRNEITEHFIYKKLAVFLKDREKGRVLEDISNDEKSHYEFWKSLTQKDVLPDKVKVGFFVFISKIFGLTFGLKLLEQGE